MAEAVVRPAAEGYEAVLAVAAVLEAPAGSVMVWRVAAARAAAVTAVARG